MQVGLCVAQAGLTPGLWVWYGWSLAQSELHAIEVPEFAEEKVDLAVYRTMLEGVATDRATVPVILHCLLEQVAFSMLDPEELARSAQLEAERDAAQCAPPCPLVFLMLSHGRALLCATTLYAKFSQPAPSVPPH